MTADPVEQRIAGFVDRYTPAMAATILDCRQRLRALFPRGYELVFDNYNALVFGFAPSEKSSQSFVSIAAYPRWVTLFFLNGATLDDPGKLLEGSGSQIRGVRLKAPQDLDEAPVQALLRQAMQPYAAALQAAPPLTTQVKMEAAKLRPRRPAGSA
jgi:hypothetical protein